MDNMIIRAEVIAHMVGENRWEVRVISSGTVLFVTTTPDELEAQLIAYSAGIVAGMDAGRQSMQQEIREALGFV